MVITKYHNVPDEELVNIGLEKGEFSPLIQELAQRLDAKTSIDSGANHRVECPVCEAALVADYDQGNNMFEVKVDRDA
jgi:predicted ATPase